MSARALIVAKLAPLLTIGSIGCTGVIASDQARPGQSGSGSAPNSESPAEPAEMGGLDVGTVPIHQVSAREYNNTVRDLLGTTLRPAEGFQSYQAAGFDTLAAAGVMNSRKVSDYFDAAAALAADAFSDPARLAGIVTCAPAASDDTTCAKSIIESFGLRAFRRPLTAEEVADFILRYQEALAQQQDHVGSLQHVVRAMLSSPQFIYRIEFDEEPTAVHPLSGYEVATRLSYLLWSSMPDSTLFEAAASGEISAASRLEGEVDRMLLDPRSQELVDNFAAQWLGARRLDHHVVDTTAFPAWNDGLRLAMQQEMGAYFDEFLHGELTYDTFLTSRVNYVNGALAAVYGLPDPGSDGLTRVQNDTGLRAGFLGLAGFLTHTSRVDRSAPSIRGQWITNSLACHEVELPANFTPPPLAEALPGQTVRDLIEQHRANTACAPCHNVLDPIGLGLEHFDAIGGYRDSYADGLAVDAAGVLPDGSPFNGAIELVEALSRDPKIVACAAEKLFVYGLGRTLESSEGHLDQIVAGWSARGLSLRNLLKELVINDTFRSRHGG